MINAQDFLDQVAAVTKHQINNQKVRIGFIDHSFEEHLYPEVWPRIVLDGEGLSHRGYQCVSTYTPMRGDRVVLLPVGKTYVILGSVDRVDRDLLKPGQLVFKAARNNAASVPSGDTNGVVMSWNIVDLDLLGSLNYDGVTNTVDVVPPMQRFQPPIPGWYMFQGHIGFMSRDNGWRRARWLVNGAIYSGGHMSYQATTSGQMTAPAPTIPIALNGSTDYVELEAAQLSTDGSLDTSTGTLRPEMSVTYVGPLNGVSGPSQLNLE